MQIHRSRMMIPWSLIPDKMCWVWNDVPNNCNSSSRLLISVSGVIFATLGILIPIAELFSVHIYFDIIPELSGSLFKVEWLILNIQFFKTICCPVICNSFYSLQFISILPALDYCCALIKQYNKAVSHNIVLPTMI